MCFNIFRKVRPKTFLAMESRFSQDCLFPLCLCRWNMVASSKSCGKVQHVVEGLSKLYWASVVHTMIYSDCRSLLEEKWLQKPFKLTIVWAFSAFDRVGRKARSWLTSTWAFSQWLHHRCAKVYWGHFPSAVLSFPGYGISLWILLSVTDKQGKIQIVGDHTVSWWIHKPLHVLAISVDLNFVCWGTFMQFLLNSSADVCVARYAVQLALLIEKVCDCFNISVKPVLMFTLDWTEFLLFSCWKLWLHLGDKSVVCTDIRTRHQ